MVLEEQRTVVLRPEGAMEEELPSEITYLSGLNKLAAQEHVEQYQQTGHAHFNPTDPVRVVLSSADKAERDAQVDRLLETLNKGRNPTTLTGRGVFYIDRSDNDYSTSAKAFLFTGQGESISKHGYGARQAFRDCTADF